MSRIATEDVQEAIDQVWKDPRDGEYKVKPGERRMFRRHVISITEDLGLDNDEHRLSDRGAADLVQDIIIEAGRSVQEADEKLGPVDEFENQKQTLFSDVLGAAPIDYEVVFPLNLQVLGSMPGEIDLGESDLELLEFEEWRSEYLEAAQESESSNFEAFYDENPNDPDRIHWSYWRVIYSARDPLYAIYEVQDTLRLLMAEINFIHHRWTSSMPRPAGSDRAPRDRWSHLQLPFVFLAFQDNGFEQYYALDYDYRGGLADRTFMPDIDNFDSLPGFYKRRRELEGLEEILSNVLMLFQDGITEPVFRRSFFDFWRGIEHLAGEARLKNEEITTRALFALNFVRESEEGLLPEIEEAIDEVGETRNKLTHKWPDARLGERHRDAAKLLLDGLLTLYIENIDEYDREDFQYLLKFGPMTQSGEEIEKIVETLERLEVLNKES